MTMLRRAARSFVLAISLAALTAPAFAEAPVLPAATAPRSIETTDPWIYRGTDIPQDKDWVFGTLPNGLRYAVRRNTVPPEQVSIRVRIDAGSLYEKDEEQGFAHLLEHLLFRESKYLGKAEAIPRWQRLGATFGSDTNAETTPTQTVYQLDLPNATGSSLEESFKLLSGMVRDPVLSQENINTEVPIVLAEKRERGGPGLRVADATRKLFYAGQPLADRAPIGTDATLKGATAAAVQGFHDRWYRPENTVIVVVGDADPYALAAQIEKWFADWKGKGKPVPAPDFGKPVPPAGADPANPVGETAVMVEPDLPRMLRYGLMRPYVQVIDNLEYNRGLMIDAVGQAIINRRLESRARAGGSYLFAQVMQNDVSRSTDGTYVSITPLEQDWRGALKDVRAVIADALATPPTEEEIAREVAEIDVQFASQVEQRTVIAASKLADDVVQAVDIREAVADPETVLRIFREMRARFTPQAVLEHTRALFKGDVVRAILVAPASTDGDAAQLKSALMEPVVADGGSRIAAKNVSFKDLPAIGKPQKPTAIENIGMHDIERVIFANGVRALIWPNNAEPGRVQVKVRFGSGYRGFTPQDAVYASMGQMALIGSGVGPLGQEELDRISTGRKMGFDFNIEDAVFSLTAETRGADLADQLYLFAGKLDKPRWDANPVLRAKAAARLQYESYATAPDGVLERDLDWLLANKDARFATPDPKLLDTVTPAGFRKVWEPLLQQGPVEVIMFGDFDRAQGIAALERTFGAMKARKPIPADAAARVPSFPEPNDKPYTLYHRGDPDQSAAVIAWPTGGGVPNIRESRQLEILTQVVNNRLLDAMRERTGASYAPRVSSTWPQDIAKGGRIVAMAQLNPEAVPEFFKASEGIAVDLAATPPSADELARVTEPLRQLISRASTGNGFWLYNLQGAAFDPLRVTLLRSLMNDYTQTTPQHIRDLAMKYLGSRAGWHLQVLPQPMPGMAAGSAPAATGAAGK